jgi:hypothetical protein
LPLPQADEAVQTSPSLKHVLARERVSIEWIKTECVPRCSALADAA